MEMGGVSLTKKERRLAAIEREERIHRAMKLSNSKPGIIRPITTLEDIEQSLSVDLRKPATYLLSTFKDPAIKNTNVFLSPEVFGTLIIVFLGSGFLQFENKESLIFTPDLNVYTEPLLVFRFGPRDLLSEHQVPDLYKNIPHGHLQTPGRDEPQNTRKSNRNLHVLLK